jgi:UDP-glucose 4-epimerase
VFGDDYPTADAICVRDYIHVVDLVEAQLLALEQLARGGGLRVHNLGNGQSYSVKEVIQVAEEVTGRRVPAVSVDRRAGAPAVLVAEAERMRQELGWTPGHPELSESLRKAWVWGEGRQGNSGNGGEFWG